MFFGFVFNKISFVFIIYYLKKEEENISSSFVSKLSLLSFF